MNYREKCTAFSFIQIVDRNHQQLMKRIYYLSRTIDKRNFSTVSDFVQNQSITLSVNSSSITPSRPGSVALSRASSFKLIHSVLPNLILELYVAKCRDNGIEPQQGQLSYFYALFVKMTKKRTFNLSGMSLKQDSASVIASILKSNSHFHICLLARNLFSDFDTITIANALQTNSSIIHLDLSKNLLSPYGFSKFLPLIANSISLISLKIDRNHLSLQGSKALAEFLDQGQLQYLSINSTQMGAGIDFVLEAVGRSTLLFLDIGGNEISTKKLNYFSQQLFQNNQLIDLNISKNIFKDMKMFASLLMIWNIQFLNLSSNQLTGKILDPLCEALKKHQTLEKLNLSYNDLSSFPCIVKLIHSNRSIRILILQSCNVGEVSAEFIGEGLEKNRTLEQLDLSGNPMGFFGIEKLSKGLQSNEGLNILNLANCQIEDQGCLHLMNSLERNSRLWQLFINNNSIGEVGGKSLKKWIERNDITKCDFSSNIFGYKLEEEMIQILKEKQLVQKKQTAPAVKQKLQNTLLVLKDITQKEEESLKEKKILADQTFYQTIEQFNETKRIEREQWEEIQNVLKKKEDEIIYLNRETDSLDQDFNHWTMEFEADIVFYEKNIANENQMQKNYKQMKNQVLSNMEQIERQGPINIDIKKDEFRQAKLKLESKLLEFNNLQCDVQMLKKKIEAREVSPEKGGPLSPQKQRQSIFQNPLLSSNLLSKSGKEKQQKSEQKSPLKLKRGRSLTAKKKG